METFIFCEICGAANDSQTYYCFACHERLAVTTDALATTLSVSKDHSQKSSFLHGTLLNHRYFITNLIGQGGFGRVYKAIDTRLNLVVAIKQIDLQALTPRQIIEATDCYNREVQLLSRLQHDNLPRLYDYFRDNENWYMVLSFIEGETLEAYLHTVQEHRLPFKDVLNIGITLCDVLEYLHTQRPPVIFRDVKPDNIMRTPSGHVYLIDFGIARHYREGQPRDTRNLGSPGYAAPEQYGLAQTTVKSDMYSLGATLKTLLTGKEPYEEDSGDLAADVAIPRRLQKTLMCMLELDVGKRPATTEKVKASLQRIRGDHRKQARRHLITYMLGLLLGMMPFFLFHLTRFFSTLDASSLFLTAFCLAPLFFFAEVVAIPVLYATGKNRIATGMAIGLVFLVVAYGQRWLI